MNLQGGSVRRWIIRQMNNFSKALKIFAKIILPLIITGLICLLTYSFIYNLSKFVPIYSGDDFRYRYVYRGGIPASMPPISHISEFIKSVVFHFLWWNARLPAIIFEMGIAMLKQVTFNVLDSLVYLLLGVMINLTVLGKKVLLCPQYLALTYLLMWFVLPGFGQTVLWHTGAANYLWVAPIYLLFLIPYIYNHQPKYPALRFLFIVITGILAGTSNEISGPQIVIAAFLLSFFDNKDFEADWKWVGVITAGISAFMSIYRDSVGGESSGAYGTKTFQLANIFGGMIQYSGVLILLNLFLILLLLIYRKRMVDEWLPYQIHRCLFLGMIFFITGMSGIGALLISPTIMPRLFFSDNIFFLIAFLNLFMGYLELRKNHLIIRSYPYVIIIILILVSIPSYENEFNEIQKEGNIIYTGAQLGLKAHDEGKKEVKIPGLPDLMGNNSPFGGGYVGWWTKIDYNNLWYERHYGIKKVTLGYTGPIQTAPIVPEKFVVGVTFFYDAYIKPVTTKLSEKWYGAQESVPISQEINHKPEVIASKMSPIRAGEKELIIEYIDSYNQLVGKQQILSYPKINYDLSWISLSGYSLDSETPKMYHFTNKKKQVLKVHVNPIEQNFTIQYRVAKKEISEYAQTALTNTQIKISVPYGYQAKNSLQLSQLITAKGFSGKIVINLVKKPLLQRMATFWQLYVLLFGIFIFYFLDQIVVRLQKRLNFKKKR